VAAADSVSGVHSRALEALGVAAQLINLAATRIERALVPRSLLSPALSDANLIVLQNPDARRGAALVDEAVDRPGFAIVDYDALRTKRPLLATASVSVASATDVYRLDVHASASGANWAAATNRAGHIAIYVDGRYHSDLLVLAERAGAPYRVNLAGLPPGHHQIELRWARDLDPTSKRPLLTSATATALSGDDALVARFAPVVGTRAARVVNGAPEQAPLSTDVPMVLAPTVEHLPDGRTRITYDLMLSNEDGGIAVQNAYRQFGRTIDQEMIYQVTLDAQGVRVRDMFQGPLHVPYGFHGQRIGERPVLTIATRNNLFTSNPTGAAPRWSESPVGIAPKRRSDRELLVANPWTTAIMGKELIHEKKLAPHDPKHPVYDARRYLYIGGDDPVRQAIRATGKLHLRMKNGTFREYKPNVLSQSIRLPFAPPVGTAVVLPRGVFSSAIAGIVELEGHKPGSTFVLDASYRARALGA
jgi:hypothetical protein